MALSENSNQTVVNINDIVKSFRELGINEDDTIIVHSSLKSFGHVDGGAEAVIEGLKQVVCDGTLVFPAFRTTTFYNAYKDWDINKTPSDVGYITEVFRQSKGVYRSNQATHSVCAYGKNAKYITENHGVGKERIGVFGDTPFSYCSPWQKMYDLGAKVVMIGVNMRYNTFKHFVEYKIINDIIDAIKDEKVKEQAIKEVSRFEDTAKYYLDGAVATSPNGVWLWHNALYSQEKMVELGYLKEVKCGNSTIISFNVKDYVDFHYNNWKNNPELWFKENAVEWINKYKNQ